MTKKNEYAEGFNTGKQDGYNKGLEDAIIVIQSIMENNNMNLATSEFWIEYNTLVEEGVLK